jgi:NTE family protein
VFGHGTIISAYGRATEEAAPLDEPPVPEKRGFGKFFSAEKP